MRLWTIVFVIAGALASATAAGAEDTARDKQELAMAMAIIAKVKAAAAALASEGEAGVSTYDKADAQSIADGTYVFVWDCVDDLVVAHPVAENRGIPITPLKDKAGKPIGPEMCAAAEQPNGSWVEYVWPKPIRQSGSDVLTYTDEATRKVTYMLAVDGMPYQVGAGEYIDTMTLDQLNGLLVE